MYIFISLVLVRVDTLALVQCEGSTVVVAEEVDEADNGSDDGSDNVSDNGSDGDDDDTDLSSGGLLSL